jgi:hypothetical protein
VTYVLDLGVIVPVAFASGVLVLRRAPVGYLLACLMLILNAIIGVVVVAQTVSMTSVGLTLATCQLMACVDSFLLLSLIAAWLALHAFRAMKDVTTPSVGGR